MPGLERKRAVVGGEGAIDIECRMQNRGLHVPRVPIVRGEFDRLGRGGFRTVHLTIEEQHRDLGDKRRRRFRVQRTRLLEALAREPALVGFGIGRATHRKDVDLQVPRQACGGNAFDHGLGAAKGKIDLPQRQGHFAAVDTLFKGLFEGRFGSLQITVFQQRLAEQQMGGQHPIVLLQRILELDDRARCVTLLESGQPVLVEPGRGLGHGRGCGRGRGMRRPDGQETEKDHTDRQGAQSSA